MAASLNNGCVAVMLLEVLKELLLTAALFQIKDILQPHKYLVPIRDGSLIGDQALNVTI